MKILLINPPHKSIGSRLPNEHLPPLGLLSIGGPLIDEGYNVELLDADFHNINYSKIIESASNYDPDIICMGHSGSTSAQPIINEITKLLKEKLPQTIIIIGGVFPTYHWKEILDRNHQIDFIVCGEGEQIILDLVNALQNKSNIEDIKGIAFRKENTIIKNPEAEIIKNLDNYRIGWELMKDYNYTYWGKKKAVVIQFSRGCPYACNYCGQRLFWKKWRHRNPQLLADEIEMLHEMYGVDVINFADENPSSNKEAWKLFLEKLIKKDLNLTLVGSIRADNIVRDENHLHLYKKAGFERLLLGIENYNEDILKNINKEASVADDKKAIQLLRKHHILSMATYVVGFGEEKISDFRKSLKQLITYDPDQIQLLYATPHKWTPFFNEIKDRKIIQKDHTKWDYKHQVLENKNFKAWQVILLVKLIEVLMQTRPKAIKRRLFHKDKKLRSAMFWYNNIGKRVWLYELFEFFFKTKIMKKPMYLNAVFDK